ncbi:MAG: ATP-binding protein [Actinoallomurus sp.]
MTAGRSVNPVARKIILSDQVVAAALTCAEAAAELTSGQLAACGDNVPAAIKQLIDAQYRGTIPYIETAARNVPTAVNTVRPLPGDGAVIAFLGAVLHLHGRLRQLDEVTQATRRPAPGPLRVQVANGGGVQLGRADDAINIVGQAPEQPLPHHQLPPPRPVTDPHVRATVDQMLKLFSGRNGEPQLVMVVSGPPGAGATTAALEFLTPLTRRDGLNLHVDLEHADDPPYEPGDILHRLLLDAGVPSEHIPASTDERAAWWQNLAGDPLMLIDGAITAAQVRPLLPSIAGVVVVTSHQPLSGLMIDDAHTETTDTGR